MLKRKSNKITSYKVVFIGETSVGKSSLVLRFVRNNFYSTTSSTVGAAFFTKIINVDNKDVKLEMWDTAGQERYNALVPMYYRQSKIAIIVYDITNIDSFNKAKYWINELQEKCQNDISIILVGNKIDLADMRKISYEMGKNYATTNGFMFKEVSVLYGEGVSELLYDIGHKVLNPNGEDIVENPYEYYIDNNIFEKKNLLFRRKYCCF